MTGSLEARPSIEVPNRPVDKSSWGRSACYPRSTFYPLSDGHSTMKPPDHYALLSHQLDLSVSLSSTLVPLHSNVGYQATRGYLGKPPLRFWRRPPQSNYPPRGVPREGVRSQTREGSYFNVGSSIPGETDSTPPTYPTRPVPGNNAKLQ